MVLGTGTLDENGELCLSAAAKSRCDRAAEAYFDSRFKRVGKSVLISGGYSKAFAETPPTGREARLMADYMIGQYPIPISAFLLEEGSTTTEENFSLSMLDFPEFFEDVREDGERKLGLVSDQEHLERAIRLGAHALDCSERHFKQLPTWTVPEPRDIVIPRQTAKIIPFQPVVEEAYLAGTGDL